MKLSAVIISFNEEKNIERCLASLVTVADEILILDSFSTDKTLEICARYPTVVHQHAFDGFSAQKNRANLLAKNDYVLSIDADEALSTKLMASILDLKEGSVGAFSFNRYTNFAGTWINHCGWYPDRKLRIWNKHEGSWEGAVHEKIVLNPIVAVTHLNGDLLHFTCETIKEHLDVSYKYAHIAALDYVKRGKRVTGVHLILSPFVKFIKIYLVKKGFLDGLIGLLISANASYYTLLKYALTKYYQNKK